MVELKTWTKNAIVQRSRTIDVAAGIGTTVPHVFHTFSCAPEQNENVNFFYCAKYFQHQMSFAVALGATDELAEYDSVLVGFGAAIVWPHIESIRMKFAVELRETLIIMLDCW